MYLSVILTKPAQDIMKASIVSPRKKIGSESYFLSRYFPRKRAPIIGATIQPDIFPENKSGSLHQFLSLFTLKY